MDSGGQLGPALEIERLVLLVHRLCRAAVEKDQRPAHGCDVHGLVKAIEDQNARRKQSHLQIQRVISALRGPRAALSGHS